MTLPMTKTVISVITPVTAARVDAPDSEDEGFEYRQMGWQRPVAMCTNGSIQEYFFPKARAPQQGGIRRCRSRQREFRASVA